jgi:hypothetical protein
MHSIFEIALVQAIDPESGEIHKSAVNQNIQFIVFHSVQNIHELEGEEIWGDIKYQLNY